MLNLNPWIQLILVGALAGFLTDLILRGEKLKFLASVVAGIVGAYLGNVLVKEWNIKIAAIPDAWAWIIISALGAAILVVILRAIRQS